MVGHTIFRLVQGQLAGPGRLMRGRCLWQLAAGSGSRCSGQRHLRGANPCS